MIAWFIYSYPLLSRSLNSPSLRKGSEVAQTIKRKDLMAIYDRTLVSLTRSMERVLFFNSGIFRF